MRGTGAAFGILGHVWPFSRGKSVDTSMWRRSTSTDFGSRDNSSCGVGIIWVIADSPYFGQLFHMDDLEILIGEHTTLDTLLGRKVMTSIEVEGVHIPANSLRSRLHSYGQPLVRFLRNSDFQFQLIGSATGLAYRGRNLLVSTAHQLTGIPENEVGVINVDRNSYISSAGFTGYTSTKGQNDGDGRDLAVFEFTEQAAQMVNLQRRFFALNADKMLDEGDDVVGYLAFGCPFADQNYDVYDNNQLDTVIRSMVCTPGAQLTDVALGSCTTVATMDFDPNGLSGGPVFATIFRRSELTLKFAGVINRAGGGVIHFIKAKEVRKLLDLSFELP